MARQKQKQDEATRAQARLQQELNHLRARLQECEDTLNAIRSGEVDAIVVSGVGQEQVFTLAGTENAYRVFVEAVDEGAITVNSAGLILYANKATAMLLGRPLEQVIGASIFSFIPDQERTEFEAVFREARNNSGGRCELALSRSTGEQVPVMVSARSCIEFGAKAICMVVTDLSEQKRNEQIVADGKLARLVLNHASEPMAVCDSAGVVLHCNRAFQDLCGSNPLLRSFNESLSLEIIDGREQHGAGQESDYFQIGQALAGKDFRGIEVCLRRKNGESVHLLLSASGLLLPNSERGGVLVALFNIEERLRTEAALLRSEKFAATGRLAASIAHEINNPLAALTNLAYLIETEPDSERVRDYAKTAQAELARVAHITRQTLAFYRESTAPTGVSLTELIESALFLYAGSIRAKKLKVIRKEEFTGLVRGYPNELRQVLSNLVCNAIEATPSGGSLRIHVYRSREWSNSRKPGVRIVIGDTGDGIRADHKQHLFEPFFTTKAEKGTGLGLWVSQGIIEKHGGFIRLRSSSSAARHGTVFSVFLPLDQSVEPRRAVA